MVLKRFRFKPALFLFALVLASLKCSFSLLYPASSSMGMIASVSVPIEELLPERRLLIDWCFQMSYDLPSNLSSFYNIPIWPVIRNPKNRKRNADPWQWDIENNWWQSNDRYNLTSLDGRHPSDLSAGELYQSIEGLLVSYGFHETCLLRSVCELARHPFDADERNILTDMITFLLSPSQHEGFSSSELLHRQAYDEAENSGFLGENCEALYSDCSTDVLSLITQIIFQHN